jgi:hypothetical protein
MSFRNRAADETKNCSSWTRRIDPWRFSSVYESQNLMPWHGRFVAVEGRPFPFLETLEEVMLFLEGR